jgi:hypothetical protein
MVDQYWIVSYVLVLILFIAFGVAIGWRRIIGAGWMNGTKRRQKFETRASKVFLAILLVKVGRMES